MIPVWAFVFLGLAAIAAQVAVVFYFTRTIRTLVNAVVAKNSGELKSLEAVRRPKRRLPEVEGEFPERPIRPMGL